MTTRSVGQEIKQTRAFGSSSQEAVVGLWRTAAVLRNAFEAIAAREGITAQQYNVLRILDGARTPLPTMEIAARLIEPTPGATRLLDRLEAGGFVERTRCVEDRRRVLCRLTDSGRETVRRMRPAVDAFDEAACEPLTEKATRALIDSLDEIREGLRSRAQRDGDR